ncbi:S1 family peptidase [Spongiibacter marinus]|uniref:S1 family peptidase n=1 Tax=Spongiibacter marinus TaxID=354246 RepID=UPI0019609064|nr:serine protease [Spongiibacter marinus]MBM7421902.1 hypothetical protein [Spongiibacter marinus]
MNKVLILIAAGCLIAACGGSSSSGGNTPSSPEAPTGGGQPPVSGGGGAVSFGEPLATQIRPGVEVVADGSSCTSNFLYQLNAETVFLGVAAHCFSPDTNSGVDPCESRSLDIGFNQVIVENAQQPAELVYSSWRAMQEVGETPGSDACRYNDFALVKLHPDDIANIHPATVAFGGPVALATGTADVGEDIFLYGHSSLHFGVRELETMVGSIVAVEGGGWSYSVSTDTPAVPGDSGGPVLDSQGRALATTSVLSVGVRLDPLRNGVVNLDRALRYAKDNGFVDKGLSLITWPDFRPGGDL